MRLLKCAALLVILLAPVVASAGQASKKLSSLADSLIAGYSAKTNGADRTTVAVLPLNCEGALAKRRVGFAASELMSHRFVAEGAFTVVERGGLPKLLAEQKLQASGVVDGDTAVKLGKLLGANVLLTGNIQKIGGKYQVNARLVRVETGEVIVSGYEELDSEAFDEDAGAYLVLVPKTQTLGVYGLFSRKFNSKNAAPYVITQGDSSRVTNTSKAFASSLMGLGMLYRPFRNFQINAEFAEFAKDPDYADFTVTNTPAPRSGGAKLTAKYSAFSISYVSELSRKWRYWAGAGLQEIILYADFGGHNNFAGPFLRSGIEFRPQNRIGLGMSLKYDLKQVTVPLANNTERTMNPLSYEGTITFYF